MVSQEDKDIEFSIVSGSNEEMLFACIDSLAATMKGSRYTWGLTITSNATANGLPARLRAAYPEANIIDNREQRGFAANHNRVIRVSRARYLWLLNDDLLILPDAIRKVTEYMDRPENARVAVVSPRLLNPDGSLQPSTYGFPSMPQILLAHSGLRELRVTDAIVKRLAPVIRSREGSSRYWAHDQVVDVDTLRGACVAMRMKAVRQVGPMVAQRSRHSSSVRSAASAYCAQKARGLSMSACGCSAGTRPGRRTCSAPGWRRRRQGLVSEADLQLDALPGAGWTFSQSQRPT